MDLHCLRDPLENHSGGPLDSEVFDYMDSPTLASQLRPPSTVTTVGEAGLVRLGGSGAKGAPGEGMALCLVTFY